MAQGAVVDATDENGETPLFRAVSLGRIAGEPSDRTGAGPNGKPDPGCENDRRLICPEPLRPLQTSLLSRLHQSSGP